MLGGQLRLREQYYHYGCSTYCLHKQKSSLARSHTLLPDNYCLTKLYLSNEPLYYFWGDRDKG